MGHVSGEHRQLTEKLRNLRLNAGLSTYALAERCGFSQSKLAKIEHGRTMPTRSDVVLILDSLAVSEDIRSSLLEEIGKLTSNRRRVSRPKYVPADAGMCADFDADSTRIRSQSWHFLNTLLQLPEYSMRVRDLCHLHHVSPNQHAANVLRRQSGWLSGKRTYVDLMPYEVLVRPIVPVELHIEQLRVVQRRMRMPNLELGVLPRRQILPAAPLSSSIYDDWLAYREWGTGGELISEPSTISTVKADWAALESASLWEGEAYRMVEEAISEVQSNQVLHLG